MEIKPSGRLEKVLKRFNDSQIKLILKNVGAIQLTEGCSGACPDCGLGAIAGVKDYIPFSTMKKLFYGNKEYLRTPMFYFASDPFDYDFEGIDYLKLHNFFLKNYGINPFISTNFPKGKEELILNEIFKKDVRNKDKLKIRLSITNINYSRFEKTLFDLIPEFTPKNQLHFDSKYNLRKSYGSWEFTENGISKSFFGQKKWILTNFKEIQNKIGIKNISEFYLNSQNANTKLGIQFSNSHLRDETNSFGKYYAAHRNCKIISKKTKENIWKNGKLLDEQAKEVESKKPNYLSLGSKQGVKKGGHGKLSIVPLPNGDFLAKEGSNVSYSDLKNYFFFNMTPLTGQNIKRHRIYLRDFTEDNCKVHTKKLGEKNLNNLETVGIMCFHGTMISPEGIFNVQTRKPSIKFPYGVKITPIDPNNFYVAKYRYVSTSDDPVKESKKFRLIK